MAIDENYYNNKNQVIKAERRILKELGFCVHVKHPHKVISCFLSFFSLKATLLKKNILDHLHLLTSYRMHSI